MGLLCKWLAWSNGWRRDLDGWYVRARRTGDPDLNAEQRPDLGFVESACIAVRSVEIAVMIDDGRDLITIRQGAQQ